MKMCTYFKLELSMLTLTVIGNITILFGGYKNSNNLFSFKFVIGRESHKNKTFVMLRKPYRSGHK